MKALVKCKDEPGLWLRDIPEPKMGINDVMIRIEKTSICGTDAHIWNWDDWARSAIAVPTTIGHEFVGRVAATGANVAGFREGDLVSGEGHLVCGRCRNCMAGRRHLCAHARGIGVDRDGAFAEYLCIPMTNVWGADERISLDVLSCFDPLGNAVHTALSFPVLGEDVLITGAGPIGCMAAAVARHAGARFIVVSDPTPERRAIALRMGATLAVDPRQRSFDGVCRELGMQEGFDVGLEMSGSIEALRAMAGAMCHGGKIALLGLLPGDATFDWRAVIFNGLFIKGIYGREMYETWYKMTMMLQCGLNIDPVITHRFHFTEFEKAFEIAREGRAGKVVMNWRE